MMKLPVTITGTVSKGQSLGNTFDVPTANITPSEDTSELPHGVYYSVASVDGCKYPGITNLGIRPTVSTNGRVNAETFLYDYDDDIYGKQIAITLLKFARSEKKFSSIDELYDVIRSDLEAGRKYHDLTSSSIASK